MIRVAVWSRKRQEVMEAEVIATATECRLVITICRLFLYHMYSDSDPVGACLRFLRDDDGDISASWASYLNMVKILLGLINATRQADCRL